MTLSINPDHLPEAKDRLQKFMHELATDLNSGTCREVYQLNWQLFPLTQPD